MSVLENVEEAIRNLVEGDADSEDRKIIMKHLIAQDERLAKLEAWVKAAAQGQFNQDF